MAKNTHGCGPSNSHRTSLEEEMLLRWAEEDRQMRAKSLDEEDTDEVDEEDDDDDEEDEEIVYEDPPPLNEEPRNDTFVPPMHEGALIGPADVEAWKKLWFHDFKHALNNYFDYATREGFTIKIHYRSHSGRKGDNSGKLIYVTLACHRQGYKKGSLLKPKVQIGEAVMDPEPQVQPERVHNEKCISCLAKIRFCMNETTGMYKITQWVGDHNHPMNLSRDRHMMGGSRHVDDAIGHIALINKEAGIGLRSSYEILCKNAGGAGWYRVDVQLREKLTFRPGIQ
ncbi:hypothetical protein LINPERHAP2_LOCUS19787 [Linum perenne]